MFGFNACYETIVYDIEILKHNIFEDYGRALIRAEQDSSYNKTMLDAYKEYIKRNNLKWDAE